MKTKVLIFGSEGSMGRRYQAILNHLKIDYGRSDPGRGICDHDNLDSYSHFIVASPTDTHYSIVKVLSTLHRPILCEKPVSKNFTELEEMINSCGQYLSMVFQYLVLLDRDRQCKDSLTWYDYYRTGNDDLYWDCMQIIGLHKSVFSKLEISNKSPIWHCSINGQRLSIEGMDAAYMSYIHTWISGKRYIDSDQIFSYHKKVIDYMDYKGIKN